MSTRRHEWNRRSPHTDDGLERCVCGGVWSDSGCDLDESGLHIDLGVAWPCCLVEGCHRAARLREGVVRIADGLAHDDPLRAELKQLVAQATARETSDV